MKYISLIFIGIMTVGMIGCQDPDYGTPAPSTTVNYAHVLYVNAAPKTSTLSFLLNNSESASLTYPAASNYVNAVANSEQFKIKNVVYGVVGKDTVAQSGDLVLQSNLNGGASYTIFLTDTLKRPFTKGSAFNTATGGKGGLQFISPIADVLTTPVSGNAGVRFLNVAAGAPAVFLTAGGTTLASPLSTSRAYKATGGFTSFTSITAKGYDLQVRTGSATGPVVATLPGTALVDGKLYTIYLSGLRVGTSVKVPYAINIIQHN
jgi:hypothetical protein